MITNKKEFRDHVKADKLANLRPETKPASLLLKEFFFSNLVWEFLLVLRKAEYFNNCRRDIVGRLLFIYYYYKFRKLSVKLGFTIPLNVFDAGLSIPHYGTIVVNATVKVGKNCRLHTSVNIGASGGESHAPVIGNNVYIGPGAIIFGNITIHDNNTIAANSTVNKSTNRANVTIAGTPAKVIKENTKPWWETNGLNLKI